MWEQVHDYHTWPKNRLNNDDGYLRRSSLCQKHSTAPINENVKSNLALTAPPCTILLRISGDFERISDAAVIENREHLFYEKPVGNVVILEDTSHKVLYIMNRGLSSVPGAPDEKAKN